MAGGLITANNNAVAKVAKKLGRFYKSASGGGGGDFDSDTFMNLAKVAVFVIVLIIIGYFVIGILGGTLIPTLPQNSNITPKITGGINYTLTFSQTLFEIVVIVVILAAIGVAMKYIIGFFGKK
ncbi:MAG: hypothetical protein QXD27_08630 [Metallosphaera sp.]